MSFILLHTLHNYRGKYNEQKIFKILAIRKNNQIFRRGTVRNIQMSLGREILKLEQENLDLKHDVEDLKIEIDRFCYENNIGLELLCSDFRIGGNKQHPYKTKEELPGNDFTTQYVSLLD